MIFLKKIISWFKKKKNIMMLNESDNNIQSKKTNDFLKSLKLIPQKQTKKLKTHISYGDGLGIDSKISG